MSDFDLAIIYVLQNEGGFVNNPNDLGSATNFGISTPMLATARGSGVSVSDIQNLTVDEAKSIYKHYFWEKLGLDELPQGVATAILDVAVNMGQGRASFFAQIACGLGNPDGVMGPKTREQILSARPHMFLTSFVSVIADYYCDLVIKNQKQIVFLKGWIRRALRLMSLIENI